MNLDPQKKDALEDELLEHVSGGTEEGVEQQSVPTEDPYPLTARFQIPSDTRQKNPT